MRPNGVIYITNSDDKNLLTSDSLFYNSLSSNDGGSIYVKYGACIQYHVCSINSSLSGNKNGCHSYVKTNKENFVIESSISQCKGYAAALYLYDGKLSIDSTNISYAKCEWNAAYVCHFLPSYHMINFTTIYNNTADRQCIMYHNGHTQSINKCKVIQNEHKKINDPWGIIYNRDSDLTISFSIFSLNIGPSLFYNSNTRKFVVDKCYIDSNNVDRPTSGNPVTSDTLNSLEFYLSHLSTQDCYAEFPIFITSFREKTIFFESNSFEEIFLMFYCFINS